MADQEEVSEQLYKIASFLFIFSHWDPCLSTKWLHHMAKSLQCYIWHILLTILAFNYHEILILIKSNSCFTDLHFFLMMMMAFNDDCCFDWKLWLLIELIILVCCYVFMVCMWNRLQSFILGAFIDVGCQSEIVWFYLGLISIKKEV